MVQLDNRDKVMNKIKTANKEWSKIESEETKAMLDSIWGVLDLFVSGALAYIEILMKQEIEKRQANGSEKAE